ncbi:MAG: metallophosphatase family protein [Gammaproteobacteria bacterium]|nr:metallophosphatase family protein [Gammaproteobacteria bacterium]
MTTKIGLIGDVHSHPNELQTALSSLHKKSVDLILCTGDIADYGEDLEQCVQLLIQYQCKTIIGNHDRWHLLQQENKGVDLTESEIWISELPSFLEFTFEGIQVYLVHSRPPDHDRDGIKLLDKNGVLIEEQKRIWQEELKSFEPDVLVVGHSHQVYAEQLGNTLVINPGSPCFNNVYGILTLPEMSVEFFVLPDQEMVKSWNWGTHEVNQNN